MTNLRLMATWALVAVAVCAWIAFCATDHRLKPRAPLFVTDNEPVSTDPEFKRGYQSGYLDGYGAGYTAGLKEKR